MKIACLLISILSANLTVYAADTCDQYCNSNYSQSSKSEENEACKKGFRSASGFADEKTTCEISYSTTPALKDICIKSSLVYMMNCRS